MKNGLKTISTYAIKISMSKIVSVVFISDSSLSIIDKFFGGDFSPPRKLYLLCEFLEFLEVVINTFKK